MDLEWFTRGVGRLDSAELSVLAAPIRQKVREERDDSLV